MGMQYAPLRCTNIRLVGTKANCKFLCHSVSLGEAIGVAYILVGWRRNLQSALRTMAPSSQGKEGNFLGPFGGPTCYGCVESGEGGGRGCR